MKIVNINGTEIYADEFAYDGCHKIYLLESEEERQEAIEAGYQICSVNDLEEIYWDSCPLRFISTWNLDQIIPQCFEKTLHITVEDE